MYDKGDSYDKGFFENQKAFDRKEAAEEKSRVAAGVLALFVGGLGIHKFYMRKPLMGIVYILFCWTGIPSLVSFVEGIIYLLESDERFRLRIG